MKATAIVRKIDELGRIVIPIELRRVMNIGERDSLEIFVDGSAIVLKKYSLACSFCGSEEDICQYRGKAICSGCIDEIKKK